MQKARLFLFNFFNKKYTVLIAWIILAIIATHSRIHHNAINNYLIFKYSYIHALKHINLYADYPTEYYDSNHYGPIFSLIMAPFSIFPLMAQLYIWNILNAAFLFYAISKLPMSVFQRNMVAVICSQELFISISEFQTNGAIAGLIILSWVAIRKDNNFWAAFCIALGFYIKLYGIVGLAFFFFTKKKWNFVVSMAFWTTALFVLPMLFFTPSFILQSYSDWYDTLVLKNQFNQTSIYQDVSVMGMVRRILNDRTIPTLPFLLGGIILFFLPFLRIDRYKDPFFRTCMLASVLLFIVLFSTGSELVTYIIAYAGIGIWFMALPRPLNGWEIILFIFAIYVGSLYTTDVFPRYIKHTYIRPYALKALPSLAVWLVILFQMIAGKTNETKRSIVAGAELEGK